MLLRTLTPTLTPIPAPFTLSPDFRAGAATRCPQGIQRRGRRWPHVLAGDGGALGSNASASPLAEADADAEAVFLAVLLCQPRVVSPCLASGLEVACPWVSVPDVDQRQELNAVDSDKGPSSWPSAPLRGRLTMMPKVPPVGSRATLGSVQEAIGVTSPLGSQQNK